MNATEFSTLKQSISQLSPNQRKQLEHTVAHPDGISYITKQLDSIVNNCPYCQCSDLLK
ncbi:hypothetical protein [Pseudoalteromonas luteoviolacea]|uniref:hypothetical protein n=1 Tax=Pseudoalteromonas luteoviolacea TaxID=43657 RepID=UPI000AA7B224|nr:hypothetical protein [Pseudoalteromonas luteoviolacea]